ncbi:alpha/beta hydrolase [Sphingomonas sp. AAP5]|uniref:alpha/beta hydrolase n=1 Tax=Sphingomonas sp. AAP5 TaxID=1523415 RepID=UPI001057324B|nr:alpha/beta hydrolase [Sphingomonas sp. AAP5]QBM77418.1 alpha/beta hydrolase [Sphingomonas sp. AAP5]
MTRQSDSLRAAITALGRTLGPTTLVQVQDLFRAEQDAYRTAQPASACDLAYGDDPRQRLDLYAPPASASGVPVVLWVHGGGFVRGEKSSPDHPFNAHVGRWAARSGMLGAVMNYRLAPEAVWPAGGEDVGAAIDWLRANAADHGGDPDRIVVIGTSAGAVHVATHLRLRAADPGVCGAVLLSGLYGYTPLEERDMLYYGPADTYPARHPRDAMVETGVPLLIACAEFDPARFQTETIAVLAARLARHGHLPRSHIAAGHNHFSLACHIGGADTRMTDEIRAFIADVAAPQQESL